MLPDKIKLVFSGGYSAGGNGYDSSVRLKSAIQEMKEAAEVHKLADYSLEELDFVGSCFAWLRA
jgi:hypothetical protein